VPFKRAALVLKDLAGIHISVSSVNKRYVDIGSKLSASAPVRQVAAEDVKRAEISTDSCCVNTTDGWEEIKTAAIGAGGLQTRYIAAIQAAEKFGLRMRKEFLSSAARKAGEVVVVADGRALNRKRELYASQLQGSSGITFGEMCEDPRYGKGGVLDIVAAAEEVADLTPIVRRAVGNLSPRQRQVVTLWYREGMANKEIAQKTGLNEHTVSSHLCVGRKRLRQLLDGAENDGLQGRKKATAEGRPKARRAEPRAASAPMSRVSGVSAKGTKARSPHHRSVEGETYHSQ